MWLHYFWEWKNLKSIRRGVTICHCTAPFSRKTQKSHSNQPQVDTSWFPPGGEPLRHFCCERALIKKQHELYSSISCHAQTYCAIGFDSKLKAHLFDFSISWTVLSGLWHIFSGLMHCGWIEFGLSVCLALYSAVFSAEWAGWFMNLDHLWSWAYFLVYKFGW